MPRWVYECFSWIVSWSLSSLKQRMKQQYLRNDSCSRMYITYDYEMKNNVCEIKPNLLPHKKKESHPTLGLRTTQLMLGLIFGVSNSIWRDIPLSFKLQQLNNRKIQSKNPSKKNQIPLRHFVKQFQGIAFPSFPLAKSHLSINKFKTQKKIKINETPYTFNIFHISKSKTKILASNLPSRARYYNSQESEKRLFCDGPYARIPKNSHQQSREEGVSSNFFELLKTVVWLYARTTLSC